MSRRRPSFVIAALGVMATVLGAPDRVGAQSLGGQVVRLDSNRPIGGASVALVDDSARVVTSSTAGTDGTFYLDAPKGGEYRLVLFVAGASFIAPLVRLDSGQTIERLFSVPDVPDTFSATPFARDVTRPAEPIPGSAIPVYPRELAANGVRALVSTMFVVSDRGIPDVGSLRVLSTADEAFVRAVRDALVHTRFVPAQQDSTSVPQVVQYSYDFGLPGDEPRGDVSIRPVGTARRTIELPPPSRDKYIIGPAEFASSDVAGMMLPDALKRLRPAIYTLLERDPKGAAGIPRKIDGTERERDALFTVDGIRVPGMDSLAEIPARHVRQVRFWRFQEVGATFGMNYGYAVTVELLTSRE